jgi:hypothetical protein
LADRAGRDRAFRPETGMALLRGGNPMRILSGHIRATALLVALLLVGLSLVSWDGGTFAPPAAQAQQRRVEHPRIRAAIKELREARAELQGAGHNFGGHREAAIAAIDAAIVQLEKALQAAERR